MQRIATCLAVFAVVAALSATASAQELGIEPGKAIGSLQLGADLEPIIGVLGPLHSEDDLPGGTFRGYYWPLKRIGVIVDRGTKKVVALAISYEDG
jgi:hypothetical protein